MEIPWLGDPQYHNDYLTLLEIFNGLPSELKNIAVFTEKYIVYQEKWYEQYDVPQFMGIVQKTQNFLSIQVGIMENLNRYLEIFSQMLILKIQYFSQTF